MTPTQDRPAAELDPQLNTTGGGRTQAPVSASPRGAAGRVAAVPPRAAAAPHSSRPRAAQRAAGTGNQHAAKVIAAAMSEDRGPDSLEANMRRLMKDLGLWGYHPRRSEKSEKGWPDWVIIGTRMIHRELKTERGKVSDEQQAVGIRIAAAGGDWAVWRPSDLLTGRIATELRAITAGPLGLGGAA